MSRVLAVLLVLVGSVVGVSAIGGPAAAAEGVMVQGVTIPGEGGTPLRAKVFQPRGRGGGPFPLLVMPSPWGFPSLAYAGAAARLAYRSGYVVVAYTDRGFWDSGGQIEVAGPRDVADASAVIDWALRHTPADANRIGMAGISYGGGISLLTAAADRRVRAVAAMSAWADLGDALYPNQTVNRQGVELLLALSHTGRPGEDLRRMEAAYRSGRFADALPLGTPRSPARTLDALNANRPAILLANAWEDSVFATSQTPDLYQRLAGPKQLMLFPGDHATQEMFGAAGLPNDTWDSVGRWFDRYLGGVPVDVGAPVKIKPANGGGWRSYPDWPSATADGRTYYLTEPAPAPFLPATGALADRAATGWRDRIIAGYDTAARSGTIVIAGVLQASLNMPVEAWTPAVNRAHAGVWAGPAYQRGTTVSGYPRLHLTVTPSAASTSLFVHLYDVDGLGRGALVTHEPITLRNAIPGRPQTVTLGMQPVRWEVPAGHHLELVVDTVDPHFEGESQRDSTVTFESPASDPSWLQVPTG